MTRYDFDKNIIISKIFLKEKPVVANLPLANNLFRQTLLT